MRVEQVGKYEIEYGAIALTDVDGWAAQLAIYAPSSNPMHRLAVFPEQRVAIDRVFASPEEAEQEAHRIALEMTH